MMKKVWTVEKIVEIFEVRERFIAELEEEEIISSILEEGSHQKTYSESEVEKLRLAKMLMEDMDVNLAGVEIILRMRQELLDMRRQFDAILEDIAGKIRQ